MSEPVRVIRKFASIGSDGKNLFIYNEEGLHRIGSGLGQSAHGQLCASSPLMINPDRNGFTPVLFGPPTVHRMTMHHDDAAGTQSRQPGIIERLCASSPHQQQQQQRRRQQQHDSVEHEDKCPGWIACCRGKIYVRSPEVVGAAACVNPESLEIEGILSSMGGGVAEYGSRELTPAIFREQVSSSTPMFSDGNFLCFARFERPLEEMFGDEEDEAGFRDDETKLQTLSRETKTKEDTDVSVSASAKSSWSLEPTSIECSVDIVDPTREGSPLVRRVRLSTSHSSVCIGPRAGTTTAVDNESIWDSGHDVLPSSILGVDTGVSKESGPNVVCSGSSCSFKDSGYVKSWTVRTTQAGRVVLSVWRRVSRNRFKKVGRNILCCGSAGLHTLRVASDKQIRVNAGDLIGAVASQILCCKVRGSETALDERVQVAYGNDEGPNSLETTSNCVSSESIVEFQRLDKSIVFAMAANVRYDEEGAADCAPWLLPSGVNVTKIGPENCSCYTNGDEIGIIFDYGKLRAGQPVSYGGGRHLGKRCFIFSMDDGMLHSETNILGSTSSEKNLISSVRSADVECLSTCYDSTAGSLWTCTFDTSYVMQFAACPHMPREAISFLIENDKDETIDTVAGIMKPIDAAKTLMSIMSRRAKEVSPSEVHMQACAEARARRIAEREQNEQSDKLAQNIRLHLGQSITARYGPGWFLGEISRINADGTYGILYADGDRRSAVRPESIKVVQADGSEIVATKWRPTLISSDSENQSLLRSDECMLSESSWFIPSEDALFLPLSVEISVESFIGLHDLIVSLLDFCREHAEKGSFEVSGVEELLIGALSLLRVNAQRLLLAGVDCSVFKQTSVRKEGTTVPILESIRDILHHIFTGSWLEGTGLSGEGAQRAASAALTDGLDLWFTDPRQQIELLHAILEPRQDGSAINMSSAYDSLLCQFAREGAVTKLVRTAIRIVETPTRTNVSFTHLMSNKIKRPVGLTCETTSSSDGGAHYGRPRLVTDSKFGSIFTQLVANARREAISALVDEQQKVPSKRSSESSPVLKLLSSLQMEVLLLVSEKRTDLETIDGEKLLVKHMATVLASSVEVMDMILDHEDTIISNGNKYTWEQFSGSVRCALDRTFLGNLLPMLCSVVVSLLLPLHDVPMNLVDLQACLGESSSKKWCIDVSNSEWITQSLPLAMSALACFDKVDVKWNELYERHHSSSIRNFNNMAAAEMPFEILHTEPKLQFIRRQLSSLVGSLSGALVRMVPDTVSFDVNANGLSDTASRWICSTISHARDQGGSHSLSEIEQDFLQDIVNASGDMAKAARHLAWKARSPVRQTPQSRGNDLSVDGSVAGHLQELARSVSHKIRRNLAVKVHSVNEAERAVAAAMIHHCGLTHLAQQYSSEFEKTYLSPLGSSSDEDGGSSSFESSSVEDSSKLRSPSSAQQFDSQKPPKPPKNLIYLWKQARRARKWLKQQKDKVSYSGGVAAYDTLATQVRDRAMFLLELRPSYLSLHLAGKLKSDVTPSAQILEAVLNFATSPIPSKELLMMRNIIVATPSVYSSRQLGIESATQILKNHENPDTLLHTLIPIIESVRHLPSAMAISGMLVQDSGVNSALEVFFNTVASRIAQSSSASDATSERASYNAYSFKDSRGQQWRSLLCVLLDLTVSLSPLMRPENLLQSQMLSSLLSVAMPPSDDTPASQDSDSDDSSEDARIIDIFASPPTPKGKTEKENTSGSPKLWNTEVQEVLVKPKVSVSSINFAHSPDPSVLLHAGGHWQSDGNLPHWIELKLPEPVNLCRLRILLMNDDNTERSAGAMASRIDHSFCPRVLSVFVGTSSGYLQEFRSMEVGMTTDWISLIDTTKSGGTTSELTAASLADVSVVRLEIAHNHMSGQNTRLAQVQITASVPTPSEHSLIVQMKGLVGSFAWSSVRVVLDNILGKLEKRYSVMKQRHGSIEAAKPFLKNSRQLLSDFFSRIVGKHGGKKLDPKVSSALFQKLCQGLLPLILHAKSPAVQDFFEIPHVFGQLVYLSQTGPVKSKTLALRLLRQILPSKHPDHWNKILISNSRRDQVLRPSSVCYDDGLLGVLLQSVGTFVITSMQEAPLKVTATKQEKGQVGIDHLEDAVISESLVLVRMLSNSPIWLPSIRRVFGKIISETLRNFDNSEKGRISSKEDWKDKNTLDNDLLGLCAAVFSVVGGYKDTLRVGGFATWSENYKARRQDSNSPSLSSSIDEFEPLLLVLSIQAKNSDNSSPIHSKAGISPSPVSTSSGADDFMGGKKYKDSESNTLPINVARVKIIKGMYRTEDGSIARDGSEEGHDVDPITVDCNEIRAVSEILNGPERLVDLDEPESKLIALLNNLLNPRQPEYFTRMSLTCWQELKTIAIKASTQLLRSRKTCAICARHPTFLSNLLSVATHPAAEVAAVTEAAEGVEMLEIQSREIQSLKKQTKGAPSVTYVQIQLQLPRLAVSEDLGGETKGEQSFDGTGTTRDQWKDCSVTFKPSAGQELTVPAVLLHHASSEKVHPSASTAKSVVGELVTTSELYTCSSNDCGGRSILLADYTELNELDLHGDAKIANALIVVQPSVASSADESGAEEASARVRDVSKSVSKLLRRAQMIVSISSTSLEKLHSVFYNKADDIVSWRNSIEVGDRLDAIFWPTGLWLRTTVVDMDHRYVPARRFIKLTYNGLPEEFDIWSSRDAVSIAPAGTRAVFARHGFNRIRAQKYLNSWRRSLTSGSLIDAKDTMGNWYKSMIIDTKGEEVKVHYQGWKPRWDIWMHRKSDDLAPLCTKTRPWRDFKKGDVVDANPRSRDDHTAWTEGIVTAIERASRASIDSFHIHGLAESINGEGRVLIRFPSLNTEQWFKNDSEELCVPGTHVTAKRKEKSKKSVLPPSVRKTVRPRPQSSLAQLEQLGFSRTLCHRAIRHSQDDLPAAVAWLFEHAGMSLKTDSSFPHEIANLKRITGGTQVIRGARRCKGGKCTYHTAKPSLSSQSATLTLWIKAEQVKSAQPSMSGLSIDGSSGAISSEIGSTLAAPASPAAEESSKLVESKDLRGSDGSASDGCSYVLIKGRCAFHGVSVNSKVRAMYGSKWYDGKIRKINPDGSCTVVYSDGDVKLSVPEHAIRIQRPSCNPFQVYLNQSGHLEISLCTHHAKSKGCEFNTLTSSMKFQKEVWTHVSFTVRAAEIDKLHGHLLPSVAQLYLNGVLDAQIELEGKLLESDWPICIGGSETDHGLECTISNLDIYSRCLSTAEVIVSMRQVGDLTSKLPEQDQSILEIGDDTLQLSEHRRSASPQLAHVTLRVLGDGERGGKEDDVAVKVQVRAESFPESQEESEDSNGNEVYLTASSARATSRASVSSSHSEDIDDRERDEREHMQSMRARIRNLQGQELVEIAGRNRSRTLAQLASYEINQNLHQKVQFAIRAAQKHELVVDVGGLANRCGETTYAEEPCAAHRLLRCSRKILCKGAAVKGRVGSRWYTGHIHAINSDSTLDIAFDDNDFRPSMPSERVQVLVQQADKCMKRWVLASEVQKLSIPELQPKNILRRKSPKELYRMAMSTELLLQTIYARYAITALVRGWPDPGTEDDKNIPLPSAFTDVQSTATSGQSSRVRGLPGFCRYLRMLSTHEFSLTSKRRLMSWSERFQECASFSGLASGVTYIDSGGWQRGDGDMA